MFEGGFGALSFASFLQSFLRIKTNKPSLLPSPLPHSSGKVLMEYGSGICPLQASPVLSSKQTARLCSWLYVYLDDKFFTREDAGLVGKVLMELRFAVGIMHTCERSASVNNVQSASGL
ncbi:hypothetical protein CMV_008825 [Castanea mollissima]|uniref:Uncharacterized protein n=1 Tax=Castanea mollissima TaxID=60419 RepID=A0A8J4RM26_9ROSI|nr:hypothetical protein CMV_008825 [Castanea mollissima]